MLVGTEQCTSNPTNCVHCTFVTYTTWTDSAYDGEGRNKRDPSPLRVIIYQLTNADRLPTRIHHEARSLLNGNIFYYSSFFFFVVTISATTPRDIYPPFVRREVSSSRTNNIRDRRPSLIGITTMWHTRAEIYTYIYTYRYIYIHTHIYTHAYTHVTLTNYTFTGHT